MAIKCDAQGRIKFKVVLAAINVNDSNIKKIASSLNAQQTKVLANETRSKDNDRRLSAIEHAGGTIPVLSSRLTVVESDLAKVTTVAGNNTTDIAGMATDVTQLKVDVVKTKHDVTDLDNRLIVIEGAGGGTGSARILKVSDALTDPAPGNLLLTQGSLASEASIISTGNISTTNRLVTEDKLKLELIDDNFSIVSHVETSSDGGAATKGSWEPRSLNEGGVDELGILIAGDKVQLDKGKYQVTGYAYADPSTYHQVRMFNVTTSKEVILGGSGMGTSHLIGEIVVPVSSIYRFESQVDTTVAAVGYGKKNPFGSGVFLQMKIELLGE